MRKLILYTGLFFVLGIFLVACDGGSDATSNENNKKAEITENSTDEGSTPSEEGEDPYIEVDKGLLSVEVTLPPAMFEGEDIDEVIANAKEDGVGKVTKNEDGSLTYKMSKSVHKELMKEAEKGIHETIEELKSSEDFVSIEDITTNHSFSEFTLVVDQEAYENSFDGFAAFGLGVSGLYYQLFDGVDTEDYKVVVSIKNKETGEVFDTIVYPDALEEN